MILVICAALQDALPLVEKFKTKDTVVVDIISIRNKLSKCSYIQNEETWQIIKYMFFLETDKKQSIIVVDSINDDNWSKLAKEYKAHFEVHGPLV